VLIVYASNGDAFSLGSSDPWSAPANIPRVVKQIAVAMTNIIQQRSSSVNGMAWEARPYVRVSWPWMTATFFLLLASKMVFVIVMLRTRRDRLWKNNVMGMLQIRIEEIMKEIPR
jgi:hypothetical protein